MRRAVFERWSTVLGGCALAGAFYYYTQFAVTARDVSGELESVIRDVVDGRGDAPYQYRVLVPRVLVGALDRRTHDRKCALGDVPNHLRPA